MEHIKMKEWGKDHWSTFAYAETLAVDGGKKGLIIPNRSRMRTNEKIHPHLVGVSFGNVGGSEYPTRLKEREIKDHDDWDCLDDAVKEGLLTDEGTGLNRAFRLTKSGKEIANQLRNHKAEGKSFSEFKPKEAKKNEEGKQEIPSKA